MQYSSQRISALVLTTSKCRGVPSGLKNLKKPYVYYSEDVQNEKENIVGRNAFTKKKKFQL
jgi:hypothetical protein